MELWEKFKSNVIVGKVIEFYKKYTDTKPILEALQSAKTIQKTISIILRVLSVLLWVVLFIFWILNWRFINHFNFFGGLGYLIWQLVFLYASVIVTKSFFHRMAAIVDLPESDYIITPIIAQVMVAVGEMAFIFLALMSVPAMLAVWFGGRSLFHGGSSLGFILSSMSIVGGSNVFLAGISVFIMFWVIGFLTLITFRLFTEITLALVSIAKDASIIRTKTTTIARKK